MAMSKLIRTVIILAVVAGAILLDTKLGLIKWIPVAAGVFYVRIILAAQSVLEFFKIKKTISTEAASDAPKEYNVIPDEEEEEDGFDKVMSHFAKGPVPGKNNENNKEQ